MIVTKTYLPSGLRVITLPMKGTKTVTVLIVVKAGSNFETKAINGISHFLEHMMFKGTKKRPTTLQIAEELDSIGGEYNAFTSKEWTGYYAKADKRDSELLFDIISDMYLNALLEEKEVDREKLVILEEMNLYLDTPTSYIEEVAEELLYGDQPQGWQVIGKRETVSLLNREKLCKYWNKRYNAENTVLIVAGRVDKNTVHKLAIKYLSNVQKKRVLEKKATVKEEQKVPGVKVHYKKTDQTHIELALRAYSADHKKIPALKLLSVILGGNMSSRLFINVREREGLGYYIRSQVEAYSGVGYLAIKAGVDNKRIMRALELIIRELKQIKENGVTSAELKKAKEYMRGRLALSLETSDELAFWAGAQEMILGRIKTPEQIIAQSEKVTLKMIKNVAEEVIQNNSLNLAVIGPYKEEREFKEKLEIIKN